MAWDGPILTDSGGFQVFSLRDTLLAVDDDGVTFRSVYDGAATRFTPELAAEIQRNLGSDVAMCLDQVPPAGVERRELEDAVRRTTEWARRQRARRARAGPAPLRDQPGRHRPRAAAPLDRGAARARLRRQRDRRPRDRRGPRGDVRDDRLGHRAAAAEKPRYFMGIGDAEGILEVIEAGVDMFDCVLPTRTARTGSAITWQGRLNLRNARYARDPRAARRELRLPGLHALLARLHPPPRQPERAAGPPPPVAAQSTLPPGAHPPARAKRSSSGRSAPSNATHWSASNADPDPRRRPLRLRLALPRPAAAPAAARARGDAGLGRAGDEIITAGGIHGVVREAEGDDVRARDRAGRRRHARPARDRGGRDDVTPDEDDEELEDDEPLDEAEDRARLRRA